MNKIKRLIRISASMLAVLMIATAIFCATPLKVEAEEDEYIYFDLAAGSVTIGESTYTGCVYVNGTVTTVTGSHKSGNHYYVYQSTEDNRGTTGYFGKVSGQPILPTYDRVTYNGESWGAYITNHPGDTNASTDDENEYDGSASVKRVITAWEDAVSGKRTSTGNKITFSGNVGEVELVIDNIWSHFQTISQGRTDGAICYNASGYDKNSITIKLKGDNRVPNIFYRTYGAANEPEFDTTYDNKMIFDVYDDITATLTVADNSTHYGGNFWNSAIGSSDSYDACKGLVFNNGVIYAGTTSTDDCTAIGGGGNGAATITINGGTITAVASTSGSTIGGGIGKSAQGGSADITITSGTIYSYNFGYGYGSQEITNYNLRDRSTDPYIVSSAIGGGSSYALAGCKYAVVNISGGTVYAQSVGGTAIGGGSSTNNNGGSTEVTISGGAVTAKSVAGKLYDNRDTVNDYVDIPAGVAIGGGTGNETGGTATLNVSGDAVLYTGSIGGGGYTATNGNGKIGPAFVTISGGTVQGQIVMQGYREFDNGVREYSTFTMTDGKINNANAANSGYVFKETNGGAVCVKSGEATISGGVIENCGNTSILGGAIYLTGGNVTINGGTIQNCEAQNGGAVYVSGGNAEMSGGTITLCNATENGGAICVDGGAFTISGTGQIVDTDAKFGGAVYVSGGNANVHGGKLTECTAEMGGAIYVVGGQVTMLDGAITDNQATNGNGGAIYVTGTTGLQVTVQSGEISGNSASANGGAISVEGQGTNAVTVQIGVNELHYDPNGVDAEPPCDHNGDLSGKGNCPIVQNNTCASEGGAIYITGTDQTNLNIYCITEEGNRGAGNAAGSTETSLSDFLKVDGGKVLISAETADPTAPDDEKIYYGNSVINSSIHVTGGDLTVKGTLANPAILAPITVDVLGEDGKAIGSYNDSRKNDAREEQIQYYVVKYFENYKAAGATETTGQYTVHQTPINESHTVWGVIYSHPGLTIVGWNTKPEKNAEGSESFAVSSVIEFEDFEQYLAADNITLELYAIWEENFYWIKFDPNADSYTGTMGTNADGKQSFLCAAESTALPKNEYVNRSYKFLGWATDSNATTAMYTDGQLIKALTQEVGKVITFYAVWEVCKHDESTKFVFTQGSDTSSVTCTCQCAYVVTATIVPPAGKITYDGDAHPANITYTNDNGGSFTEANVSWTNESGNTIKFSELVVSYDYTPILDGHKAENDATDAGTYTASATYGGVTISTSFSIAQATQKAPNKPEFEVVKVDDKETLQVKTPIQGTQGDAKTTVKYRLVYNNTQGQQNSTNWQDSASFSDFDSSWTLYYIEVYYPGNNNYLPSDTIVSDQTYIFKGGVRIVIVNEKGIASTMPQEIADNSGRVAFITISQSDYYLSSEFCATSVKGTLTSQGDDLLPLDMSNTATFAEYFKKTVDNSVFSYVVTPFPAGYTGEIEITITGAKEKPTVETSIAPNEQFGVVTDTATTISRDSAFTAYFEVNYFDTSVYSDLTLTFDQSLPKDTTIIMVDKENRDYWYIKTTKDETKSIPITDFSKMGGGDVNPVIDDALKYQFIVDFSDASTSISANSLEVKLTATVSEAEKDYAPVLQETGKTVTLASVTHSLGTPSATENSATISMEYAQGAANASKWADREAVLVLTQTNATPALPIDASITVVATVDDQTKTTTVIRNDNGDFVVTLDPNATQLKIVLQSEMFTTATYTFEAKLYAAYKGEAPMNGQQLAKQSLTLTTTPKAQNAVKITVENDTRIFDQKNDTIELTIQAKLSKGYTATVTLLRKNNVGEYVSTGWSYELTDKLIDNGGNLQEGSLADGTHKYSIAQLDAFEEGVFCLSVVVREDSSNTAVLTVPYYLIIQKNHEAS